MIERHQRLQDESASLPCSSDVKWHWNQMDSGHVVRRRARKAGAAASSQETPTWPTIDAAVIAGDCRMGTGARPPTPKGRPAMRSSILTGGSPGVQGALKVQWRGRRFPTHSDVRVRSTTRSLPNCREAVSRAANRRRPVKANTRCYGGISRPYLTALRVAFWAVV